MNMEAIMKKSALVLCLFALGLTAFGSSPTELIKGINKELVEGYTTPLVESYGVAMGTGLFYSAHAHKFLGFDIGARLMFIQIPTSAKTFDARVMACSANTKYHRIDTFYVNLKNAATIFGPNHPDSSYIPDNAVGIPPFLPGGLGLSFVPFLVPQASLGLPIPGMELLVRYVPWPFEGNTVQFLGVGLKEEITAFSGIDLPFNLAVQGFYQTLGIGDVINSTNYGGNIHISKSFVAIAPYAGIGFENTDMKFDYEFQYENPVGYDTVNQRIKTEHKTESVKLNIKSGWNFRGTIGAALKFGPVLTNIDYNRNFSTGYNAINFGLSFSLR